MAWVEISKGHEDWCGWYDGIGKYKKLTWGIAAAGTMAWVEITYGDESFSLCGILVLIEMTKGHEELIMVQCQMDASHC